MLVLGCLLLLSTQRGGGRDRNETKDKKILFVLLFSAFWFFSLLLQLAIFDPEENIDHEDYKTKGFGYLRHPFNNLSATYQTSNNFQRLPPFTAITNYHQFSNMDPYSAPFHLTFGVELEFIVNYNPEDYKNELLAAEGKFWSTKFSPTLHNKYGILICRQMIQMLNENGFSTNDYRVRDFSKWTVDTDDTVTADDTRKDWYAIELKTPALDCSDPALKQVETVVRLLDSKFNLYTNESCGLHVHVGNQDRGFTLRTLKNFCSLITAFKHQLDSLHPPNRLKNAYAKSMRMRSNPVASPAESLIIIDELETVGELISQFHYSSGDKLLAFNFSVDRLLAFNFLNLQESPYRTNTIEFRQHKGTLDVKLITNWVMVAYNLVDMSHTDSADFRDLIKNNVHRTKYTVIDLFKDLKLPDLAEFYAPLVYPQYGTD